MPARKRRALRRTSLTVGALLVSLVLLLLLPPVQRRIAEAVAQRSEAFGLEIGYLSAGPWGVALEDFSLELSEPNLRIVAASADVDIAFWRSVFGLMLAVESAELDGVEIDVTLGAGDELRADGGDRGDGAAAAGDAGGERGADDAGGAGDDAGQGRFATTVNERLRSTGFGPLARLPGWLAVDAVEASGRIRAATRRGIEVGGVFTLTATSIAGGASGAARLTGDVSVSRAGEALAGARVELGADATIDAGALIREARVSASAVPLAGGAGIEAVLAARFDADETFDLSVSGPAGVLAELAAVVTPGSQVDLAWDANLTPGLVAAFARGRSVADLAGRSSGQVLFDMRGQSLAVESETELRGAGWDVYDPRLEALGELTLSAQLDGRHTPGLFETDRLEIAIASAEHGELLLVRAEQPLSYELGEWLVDPQNWGEPALRIQVAGFPLAWLGMLTPSIEFRGGTLSGALEFVRGEERRTELRVIEPIRASDVQLAPINGVDMPLFDASIEPRATLANGALDAQIEALRLSAVSGFELTFTGQARTSQTRWPQLTLEGSVSARVPALQRIVPRLDSVGASLGGALDFETLVLSIDRTTIDAQRIDGVRMLEAELAGRSPLPLQLPLFDPDWNGFEPRAASVRLDRVPIEWISAYVPELEFRGGEMSGRLIASGAVGRGLRLEAEAPLRIEGFVPVYRGMAAASTWTASVSPTLDLQTGRSAIALEDLMLRSGLGNSLQADLLIESTQPGRLDLTLALDADLGELASRGGLRIGELHWRQTATLETAAQRYTIEELSFVVDDPTGTDIVTLEALQTFTLSAAPFGVAVAGAPADVIRATVSPIRLEQLLPNVFNLDLQGVLPEGEFFGRAEADGALTFFAAEPLVFRDVSVGWGDATLIDRVTTGVGYEVSYSSNGLQARSVDLTATGPDGRTLLRSSSRVTAPMTDARLMNRGAIEFEAYLEPLTRQPVLAGLPRLTSGTLAGSLSFVDEDEMSLNMDLRLRDAAAVSIGDLADFDIALEAAGVRGERLAVTLPLRLQSEAFGVSSLQLDGTLVVDADGIGELDASVEGERLAADDVRRFAAFVLAPEASAEAADAAEAGGLAPLSEETISAIARLRTERDSVPVWSDHLNARTRLSLDELTFSGFSVAGLRGALELTPDSATLSDVRASLFGADLTAAARVDFDAAQAAPYTLDFRADVADLELENVFLAMSPDAVPMAQGRFELTSTLTSAGRNPLDAALSSQGRLQLTGSDGIFRGLAAYEGTGAVAARVIGILTFSRELRAIGRLLDRLGEIPFEDAEFLLERNSTDRIDLSRLALRSPQLRLGVTGSLELAPLRPLLLSPLDADLSIAASGDAAILFDGMGLLEESADAGGYRAMTRSVHVGGTPVAPDATEFWEVLEEAANNARGAFGAGLRALNRRLEARGD